MINGDSAKYKVKVSVQEQQYDHLLGQMTDTWVTIKTIPLNNPGQLLTEYLTTTRRCIIEEDGNL
jgi:hypothetical protein